MAGRPLKPPEQRRNRTPPSKGEWVDLEPLEEPILPEYNPEWQVRRKMWDGWRQSPVTSQYGVEDVELIEELARSFYDLSEPSRLRMIDSLGLSPRGKRDLRWRTPAEVKTIRKAQSKATRLRAV